jgi:hypothetical protein
MNCGDGVTNKFFTSNMAQKYNIIKNIVRDFLWKLQQKTAWCLLLYAF